MKGFQLKKQLTLLKMCVTPLLCGPRADLWLFCGFLCKRFSLYIKVYLYLSFGGSVEPLRWSAQPW